MTVIEPSKTPNQCDECGHSAYLHTTVSMHGMCAFADCECREFVKIERAEPSRGAPAAAHTPGPWLDAQEYITAGSYTIARIFPGTGQESANARLIAQAPTLLAENEKLKAGHVVLLEALRHALPILIGAIAFVDCKAVVAEVRAALKGSR